MLDVLNMLNGTTNDMGNYDSRKVARDDVKGITVSTAYTTDCGYETALLDKNGVHPVERYADRKTAVTGHAAWKKKAATLKTITKLGYGNSIPDKQVTLVR